METELHRDVKLLAALVNDLDVSAREQTEGTLDSDLIALAMLEEARRNLAIICTDLTNRLAPTFPRRNQEDNVGTRTLTISGVGVFEAHKKKNRTQWDREQALEDVLDTRLIDPETGEVKDETPLDKVLHVWLLGAPRITALRDRGLNPSDYCTEKDAGWTIRLVTP